MEFFWEEVPGLTGKTIETVRFTALATTLGDSFVVVACTDGTVVRLRCTDTGCEVAEILEVDGG